LCSGKSEAEVRVIIEDCARRIVLEANYWQTRSIARHVCGNHVLTRE